MSSVFQPYLKHRALTYDFDNVRNDFFLFIFSESYDNKPMDLNDCIKQPVNYITLCSL